LGSEGEPEIPWNTILPDLGAAAERGTALVAVGGLTYEFRRIASTHKHHAILVGAELGSPQIAILRTADQAWSIVGHVPVRTRGADTLPARFIPGPGGVAFVVRAPEGWGTGTVLETTRWYWIGDEVLEVLRYPSNAYVVGWGLAFDRFISSDEVEVPHQLTDGCNVRVAFRIRYSPPDADPDGPEAIELRRTLSVIWVDRLHSFRPGRDSELTVEDANQLIDDTDASFVARNIDMITALRRAGADWAVKWISALAEQSFPTDRQRLLNSIRRAGTG
jgi:hypothetical protein